MSHAPSIPNTSQLDRYHEFVAGGTPLVLSVGLTGVRPLSQGGGNSAARERQDAMGQRHARTYRQGESRRPY